MSNTVSLSLSMTMSMKTVKIVQDHAVKLKIN